MNRLFYPLPWTVSLALLLTGLSRAEDQRELKGPKELPKKEVRPEVRSDPAMDAWVKILTERMLDRNDTIRDSARAALVELGPAALPILRKLANGDDGAAAVASRKLMAQIEHEGHFRMQHHPEWFDQGRRDHPWAFHHPGWAGYHHWTHPAWFGHPGWSYHPEQKKGESKPDSSRRESYED